MKLGLHGIPSTICIGVLAAALFGTPIYEISKNRWPGHGYSGPKTWEGIRSGRAAKAIESSAASESALKEAIRPLYNEWMFQLAGITQPGVVVGPGGWLFPSQRLKDPGETAWKEMPKTVAVMAALARNLEQNGCRVIFELIPRKRDLYPDQLPHGIEYSSPYEPVRNALLAEGMRVPDLRPALKQEGKLLFLTNDNHWNPEGCHEAARVIAGEIQAMFADGSIPGEPVDVEFARGKEFEMIGYQQKLLGFRPESRLFKSFTNLIHEVYAIAQGKPDTRHLGLWSYSPITLIGTSFSAGPYYCSGPSFSDTRHC